MVNSCIYKLININRYINISMKKISLIMAAAAICALGYATAKTTHTTDKAILTSGTITVNQDTVPKKRSNKKTKSTGTTTNPSTYPTTPNKP
jgi:hypothetical protein